jgi:dihydrofolate synthase/folylpolyglutamate synthase
MFTSPHIESVTERIKLNDADIPLSEFDRIFTYLEKIIENNSLSYFEALTLIAFKYFKESMPDVAIIETGLGGRLDSTNVLNRKIPVITSISLDHTDFLGNELIEIAKEKLAIIKENKTFYMGYNTDEVNKYADIHFSQKTIMSADYSDDIYKGFHPPFSNNLKLAELVSDSLIKGDYPERYSLPMCRMEKIGKFTLDGAHNEDALQKLFANITDKPTVIFSSTSDRETESLLKIIERNAQKVILTEIPDNDRSVNINGVKTSAIKEKSLSSAIKIAVELSENTDILICGSLYLCAKARELLLRK